MKISQVTTAVRTEDLELNVREILDKKKVAYDAYRVAQLRYLCRIVVETVCEWLR